MESKSIDKINEYKKRIISFDFINSDFFPFQLRKKKGEKKHYPDTFKFIFPTQRKNIKVATDESRQISFLLNSLIHRSDKE